MPNNESVPAWIDSSRPSAVVNSLAGTTRGLRLPSRSRTAPVVAYEVSASSEARNPASYSARSMICPWPPCTSRWYSAVTTANAAK